MILNTHFLSSQKEARAKGLRMREEFICYFARNERDMPHPLLFIETLTSTLSSVHPVYWCHTYITAGRGYEAVPII